MRIMLALTYIYVTQNNKVTNSCDVTDNTPPDCDDREKPVVHTPFAQKTDAEKDELFERIAEQLAIIADNYNLESPHSLKHPDLFFKGV